MHGYVHNKTKIWRLCDLESKRITESADVDCDETFYLRRRDSGSTEKNVRSSKLEAPQAIIQQSAQLLEPEAPHNSSPKSVQSLGPETSKALPTSNETNIATIASITKASAVEQQELGNQTPVTVNADTVQVQTVRRMRSGEPLTI